MPAKPPVMTHDLMVKGADQRAKISAHYDAHPGEEFTAKQLAEATGVPFKDVRNRLATFINAGTMKVRHQSGVPGAAGGGRRAYYSRGKGTPKQAKLPTPTPKPANKGGALKDNMIRAAEQRAKALAYLTANPGSHTSHAIADAIGEDRAAMYRRLEHLANERQIARLERGKGYANHYSAVDRSDGHGTPADERARQKARRAAAKPLVPAPTQAVVRPVVEGNGIDHTPMQSPARELELVAQPGVVIVLGPNPITGRLRISLEKERNP